MGKVSLERCLADERAEEIPPRVELHIQGAFTDFASAGRQIDGLSVLNRCCTSSRRIQKLQVVQVFGQARGIFGKR